MTSLLRHLFGRLYNAPYVLLVLTMLFWAGNVNVGRYAADYVPPIALGTLRWIGAALILLPFAIPYLRADWPVIRRHVGMLTLLSLLGIAIYNTVTYYGLQFTGAINAVILQAAGPLVMVAFAFIIFGERLGRWQMIGMLLSIVGILVTVSRGDADILLGLQFNIGDFILIGAISGYSLYSVLLRRKPSMHPLSFVTVTMAWGAILLLPFFAAELATGRTVPLEPAAFLIIAYVVIFPSLAAHFFFYRGVELIGSNRAAPFFYIIPVFATAMAIVFLDERLYLFHIVGFALILGGVVIASRQRTAATPVEVKN